MSTKGYNLIDPPARPFSSINEIEAWISKCEEMVAAHPGDEQWRMALKDARYTLERKTDDR